MLIDQDVASAMELADFTAMVVENARLVGELQRSATTDPLTGVYNTRFFHEVLNREAARAKRYRTTLSLLMIDVDSFKAINDTYGHEAGDRALRLFAQVCKETLRDADIVGRWGGEEFIFALPHLDRERAVEVLERLRTKLAGAHTGEHPRFTASYGVTDSTQSTRLEELILIADSGLYQSKHEGRGRVTIGTGPIDPPALLREATATTPTPDELDPHPAYAQRSLHHASDEEDPPPSGAEIR